MNTTVSPLVTLLESTLSCMSRVDLPSTRLIPNTRSRTRAAGPQRSIQNHRLNHLGAQSRAGRVPAQAL